MYHNSFPLSYVIKNAAGSGGIFCLQLLALAGLISDTAAGLAGRLAGSLALTAATVLALSHRSRVSMVTICSMGNTSIKLIAIILT
jgi:hypothetical protein